MLSLLAMMARWQPGNAARRADPLSQQGDPPRCEPSAPHGTREVPSSPRPTSAAQSRLPASFDELYEQHYAFVRRTVRRFGVSDATLEDVCQEVFVVVYRRWHEFEGRAKVSTWLYRIVANTARNQLRGQRRKLAHVDAEALNVEQVPTAIPGPEAHAGRNHAAQIARSILMAMSEEKRMAFVLVELEGLSYDEAASALDETFDTVRARVRAARVEFTRAARRFVNLQPAEPTAKRSQGANHDA